MRPEEVLEKGAAPARRVLVIVGALVLLVCSVALALRLATAPGPLSVPTDPRLHFDPRGDYALLEGRLHASRSGDRACFWVVPPPGSRSISTTRTSRYHLVLPSDWSADASLRLLRAFRRPTGAPGGSVALLGAPGEVRRLPGCPSEGLVFRVVAPHLP